MAHKLDSRTDGTAAMFSVGQTPWHQLGSVLTQAPTIPEALRLAGAAFDVVKRPVYVASRQEGPVARVDRWVATVRSDTHEILGIVGRDYTPLQNADAFDLLSPLIDSGQATLETGGVLRDGQDVWLMAHLVIPPDLPGADFLHRECIEPFFLIANNHSGRRGVLCTLTPIRVVCANTLAMAEGAAKRHLARAFLVRHRANVLRRTEEAAREIYESVVRRLEEATAQYEQMHRFRLADVAWKELILDKLAPIPAQPASRQTQHLYEHRLAQTTARRSRLTWLWESGPGHQGNFSAWEAYQAVTHSVDHDHELWGRRTTPTRRLASLFDGRLGEIKNATLDRLYAHTQRSGRN